MYYFITNRFFKQTSAIELAEVKRQRLFSYLGQKSTIVEIEDSFENLDFVEELKNQNKFINMYDYFQKLSSVSDALETALIDKIFGKANYTKHGNQYRTDDKYNNIQVNLKDGRVFYLLEYFLHSKKCYFFVLKLVSVCYN